MLLPVLVPAVGTHSPGRHSCTQGNGTNVSKVQSEPSDRNIHLRSPTWAGFSDHPCHQLMPDRVCVRILQPCFQQFLSLWVRLGLTGPKHTLLSA